MLAARLCTDRVSDSAWHELGKSGPKRKSNQKPPKSDLIFGEFIEEERNNVVKTYAFGARVNIAITPGGPTTFEAFMRSGLFQGQNPLELCRDAIAFWHRYLDAVDEQMAIRQRGTAV